MLGHAVDEVQYRAYGGAVPLVHLPAFVALAVSVIVVLGDGPVSGGGLSLHVLFQVAQNDAEYIGIGQAQLRLVPHAPALIQGKVLRMFVEIFLRRA